MSTTARITELSSEITDLGSLPDADLLEAWTRDQHVAALATIIDRYNVMVLSVCRRRCRSEADADDAFQSTFLYLARNSKKIRHPERLAGWLHRVAQRAAVATFKVKHYETAPMVDTPANPDDPLARLAQRHEAIVLDEELANLPEHYRAALVMHIFDDQPLSRLAEHFGTTIGSIRGRLQRGKQMLSRRLRRRGIVPVLAFAAARMWTVPPADAAEASGPLIDAAANGTLPESPIETSLLDSLLNNGTNVMSSLYTVTGLVAASAVLGILLTTTSGDGGEGVRAEQIITMPATEEADNIAAQFGSSASATGVAAPPSQTSGQPAAAVGMGAPQANTRWVTRPVRPATTSATSKAATEALDKDFEFGIAVGFSDLAEQLAETVGVPFMVDDRAVEFAEVNPDSEIVLVQSEMPLRTALRKMLRPLGLKAVVEEEGMVITADPSVLVHRGIGTSRWINIDNDAEDAISTILDEEFVGEFNDLMLQEAIDFLADNYDLPMVLDQRAMEDLGLTADLPISLNAKKIKVRNALELILEPLEMTYTIQGETLVITTRDADENKLLNRIYWLEGTGFAQGDFDSMIEMINSTIEPNIWESLGGPSTISPLPFSRPSLMVSTTYKVHQTIEQLMDSLRQSHFGADPVLESVVVPANNSGGGGMGMGMGMGGGGMGGGGGFF